MSSPYLLVRLRPVDPANPGRRIYTVMKRAGIPQTLKFLEEAGWHKVPTSIGYVLRDEVDYDGRAVFDVMTHQEAVNLERAEEARKAQRATRAKASTPHEMMVSSKRASDMAMEAAPQPAPRRAAPASQTAPKMPPAPAAAIIEAAAPDEIDWDSIGDGSHPADELQDENDAGDDEPAEMETVDLNAPAPVAAEAPVEDAPVRRSKGGRKSK